MIEIIKQKLAEGKSVRQIATELKTYPLRIRREILKHGLTPPDPSEAMKRAYKTGSKIKRTDKLSKETKLKIANTAKENWTEDRKEEASKIQKEIFSKRSAESVDNMHKSARIALLKTTKTGSKLEKALMHHLSFLGQINWHENIIIGDEILETDLMIPGKKIAIEIDGITHYEPIYGEERLDRIQRNDRLKNEIYFRGGYRVIRIKNVGKNGIAKINSIITQIKDFLESDLKFIHIIP